MKITIDIGGKDYAFEMNRDVYYRQLMQDQEYIKMQELVSKKAKNKKITKSNVNQVAKEIEKEVEEETSKIPLNELMLMNMVREEQIFCHSLSINHPELSWEERIKLIDVAYSEYGAGEVAELCSKLVENFTPVGDEPKKKMVMRMG
jgi:hypothetical protein